MELINQIISSVNSFFWDFALLILLCGTGVFFTIRLKFVQIRKLGQGFKSVFGGFSLKGKAAGKDGMSSFQSLATAVAAQVGTGNLAGAATAIISGGPGAIFWMWISAFFGMATIFAEAVLGQKFNKTANGEVTGGPVYYLTSAFKGKFGKVLAGVFAVLLIFALGFIGNMVQSNSISDAFSTAFHIPPYVTGIVVALLVGIIFFGGVKRIAAVTEKIVPVMAFLYIIGAVIVIAFNYQHIGGAFKSIFVCAFAPSSVFGGVAGVTVQKAVRFGIARGLFSNEAGMGSTPHAHAIAKVKHPCEQGFVAMIGLFIDTFVILTLTALVILTSNLNLADYAGKGIALTQDAFGNLFGQVGYMFIAVCLLFFAFSTIIGWFFFGQTNIKYLFGQKGVKVYTLLVIVFVFIGSTLKVDLVWSLSDLFNGMMVIPNLLALLALSGVVAKLEKSYLPGPPKEKRKGKKKVSSK